MMKLSIENFHEYIVKTFETSISSACFCVRKFHVYLSSWIVFHVHQVTLWKTHVLLKKIQETFSGLSLEHHNFQSFSF